MVITPLNFRSNLQQGNARSITFDANSKTPPEAPVAANYLQTLSFYVLTQKNLCKQSEQFDIHRFYSDCSLANLMRTLIF